MRNDTDLGSGNRREFLKAGLRAFALGGLALTGTVLGLRTSTREAGSPDCTLDLPCRSCRRLSGCSEPRAARSRERTAASADRSGLQDRRKAP
ncbi:MAG: hypothetical protein ACERK6_10980 [Candidatus Aminicenantaceae bacterium]